MTQRSSEGKFEDLMREHAHLIAYALNRVLQREHRELIADAEQEIYMALWNQLQKGNQLEYPSSYIYKVALRIGLKLKQQAKKETLMEPELTERIPAQSGPDWMTMEVLNVALQQLPRESERAIRAYLMGYDHKEIAALFNWSEPVARHRIYRGLNKLKVLLRGRYVPSEG
ncbi:MAG: sigma-70 family RNA polymerase sigma factor [Acidobacteria bacterium]|nr:sigma-70 family RNA polymerase sigma factor [Acidobacteriota bacterium]MCB9398233.1 sigma-70 family RNA polymerase sigma factor [Acidobacteriota bacterium]